MMTVQSDIRPVRTRTALHPLPTPNYLLWLAFVGQIALTVLVGAGALVSGLTLAGLASVGLALALLGIASGLIYGREWARPAVFLATFPGLIVALLTVFAFMGAGLTLGLALATVQSAFWISLMGVRPL